MKNNEIFIIFEKLKEKNSEADGNLNDDVESKVLEESILSPTEEEVAPRPATTLVIKRGPTDIAK